MKHRDPKYISQDLATYESAIESMTALQRRYVEARLEGMAPIPAARAAGIKHPDTAAYRMEALPVVKDAMQLASKITHTKVNLSRDDVISGLMDAVNSAGSAQDLVNAWREIGRVIGAYEPRKVEIKTDITDLTLSRLQAMPTEQLAELAKIGSLIPAREDDSVDYIDAEIAEFSESIRGE